MAKKKMSHQSKQQQQQQDENLKTVTSHPHSPMEDYEDKLQNLKSLNSILLKETIEKRQLVESLEKSKILLETELTRSVMGKREVEGELTRAGYESVGLEIEKDLFYVFLKSQMRELGFGLERERGEIGVLVENLNREVSVLKRGIEDERVASSRVCEERDLAKVEVDLKGVEVDRLKVKLVGMEKKERRFEDEISRLRKECEGLVLVIKENEESIEALKREKDSVKENLKAKEVAIDNLKKRVELVTRVNEEIQSINGEQKAKICNLEMELETLAVEKDLIQENLKEKEVAIDNLKKRVEVIMSVNKDIESVNDEQKVKIRDLEMELGTLDEIVLVLRKEKEALAVKVTELEQSYGEVMEREKKINVEMKTIKGDNEQKQRNIERLVEDKTTLENLLEVAKNDMKLQVEELIRAKDYVEGVKLKLESDISILQQEVSDLKDVMIAMQEKCKDKELTNAKLMSEIGQYKNAYEKATLESNNAQKSFNEEKKNAARLISKGLEMEKRVQQTMEALSKMKNDYNTLNGEKADLENRVGLLVQEKKTVQKSLVEAKLEAANLKAKVESISTNSEQALTKLKFTAAMFCLSKEGTDGKDQKHEREIDPYAAELKAIESAFKYKDATVENMKMQVEYMKAEKKKNMWTCVTSATLFAVASLAYAARSH